MNSDDRLEGDGNLGIERSITAAALIAFPAALLVAQLIIPFATSSDPVGDKADLVSRADAANRWVFGYSVLAIAVFTGMYAMLHLGVVLTPPRSHRAGHDRPAPVRARRRGCHRRGARLMGIGLAHVVDAGLDGNAYLEGSGEAGLVAWWFGSLTCAVSLLLIALAILRAELLAGWLRIVCLVAFGLEALSVGLLPGFGGSGWATLPAPIIGFVAFGALAFGLVASHRGSTAADISPSFARRLPRQS